MTKLNEVYKCEVCGNIVEVLHTGVGELVCCNQPMKLMTENTEDAATEKHVPVIEEKDGKILVKVGEVDHPMTEEHYIEWVEAVFGDKVIRKHLKPGDKPEVTFCKKAQEFKIRAYCNLHGLWKA